MVDYHPYQAASMPHDFDLYPHQEQNFGDFVQTSQPFLPSNYSVDPSFSGAFEPVGMPAMSEAPAHDDLQFHYDGIAQGVKPSFQYSPHGSPNSASHSFEQPPVLSASSESGASVSSSNMPSPSLNPQFNEPWNPMVNSLGLPVLQSTSGFEYEGTGRRKSPGLCGHSKSSPPPPEAAHINVFKSPMTPASAFGSALRSTSISRRRNSLLSNEVRASDISGTPLGSPFSITPVTPSPTYSTYPTLVQPYMQFPQSPYPDIRATPSPYFPNIQHPPSPALSQVSSKSQRQGSRQFKRGSQSPFLHTQQFQPYPTGRRQSNASLHSQHSGTSRKSGSPIDEETREKGLCPLPECGRVFKDLKAHMLTHQNERPEKCPIATCEYHLKGFARKYDKNRHTLTHYKGTMVCGFCPGSGSAAEKSFNRADVFKRHLTSVHGVEQNPPNSRKKPSSGRKPFAGQQNLAGTCSTCSVTFANAQEFYEHLDDCVLRVVQQADPSEAINQRLLTSVAEDKDVSETLDRNGLSNSVEYTVPSYEEEEEEEEEDEEIDVDDQNDDTYGVRRSRSGKGSLKSTKNH